MYLGLLSPHVIFILLQMQTVSPSLEFGLTQLCLEKDNMRYWHSHSLKFAHWQ